MLFTEEMNSYFGGQAPCNPTNSSGVPLEIPSPWKPVTHSSNDLVTGTGGGSGAYNVHLIQSHAGMMANSASFFKDAGGPAACSSKLVTKWGGHPSMTPANCGGGGIGGSDFSPALKNGHQDAMMASGQPTTPFTQSGAFLGGHQGGNTFAWNEPPSFQFAPQQHQQQEQLLQQTESKFSNLNLKANIFHPSITSQQTPTGHFTPPVELGYSFILVFHSIANVKISYL